MAVVSFLQDMERRGGKAAERKGFLTEITNRKYHKRFVVITDDILDGPYVILVHASCPVLGESYVSGNDTDALATCIEVRVEAYEGPFSWRVTAEYDTARVVDATVTSPLNQPPEIVWGFAQYTRPLTRDYDGYALVNSAQQAFDPPVEIDDSRPTVTITRNEATYTAATALLYKDALNSDIWNGLSPRQAKMMSISAQKSIDIGVTYWKVTYEIHFLDRTFDLFILDQGFKDIDGRLLRDSVSGAPLANASLLNGAGYPTRITYTTLNGAITAGQITLVATAVTPVAGTRASFPLATAGYPFEIKIGSEVMQVTQNLDGINWNILRGYGGTTAAAHSNGDTITMQPYFLRFKPHKVLPFATLALPALT